MNLGLRQLILLVALLLLGLWTYARAGGRPER